MKHGDRFVMKIPVVLSLRRCETKTKYCAYATEESYGLARDHCIGVVRIYCTFIFIRIEGEVGRKRERMAMAELKANEAKLNIFNSNPS